MSSLVRKSKAIAKPKARASDLKTAPVSKSKAVKSRLPLMNGRRSPVYTVDHRELVAEIKAPGLAQAYDSVVINPANIAMFPWLHKVAEPYDTYKFKSLRILYEPACATSTTGAITMGINYDVTDAVSATTAGITSYPGSISIPLWSNGSIVADPSRLHPNGVPKYVEPECGGSYSFGGTPLQSYAGRFMVLTDVTNVATSSLLGRLYVEYSIELYSAVPTVALDAATSVLPKGNHIYGLGNLSSLSDGVESKNLTMSWVSNFYHAATTSSTVTNLPPGHYSLNAQFVFTVSTATGDHSMRAEGVLYRERGGTTTEILRCYTLIPVPSGAVNLRSQAVMTAIVPIFPEDILSFRVWADFNTLDVVSALVNPTLELISC